jgi:hypothetical protein
MPWIQLTAPFSLTQGKQYSALLHLGFVEAHLANPDIITGKFTDQGFIGVTCDDSDPSNPRVCGTWPLAEADNVPFPSEVKTVWEWSP